jgi:hypothetical protein
MCNIVGFQNLSFVFRNIVGYTFIFDFLDPSFGFPAARGRANRTPLASPAGFIAGVIERDWRPPSR